MEYEEIDRYVKRYSFKSKIGIAFKHSLDLHYELIYGDRNYVTNNELPYELETFVIFALANKEWKNDIISENDYAKIINAIRHYQHPLLNGLSNEEYISKSFPSLLLNELYQQSNFLQEYYRFHYYFTFKSEDIDMYKEFYKTFNTNYIDFACFGRGIELMLIMLHDKSPHSSIYYNLLQEYLERNKMVVLNLIKTKEEMYDYIHNNYSTSDYIACLRPFNSFPFIQEGSSMYFPITYAIRPAVTTSLLHRLITNNKNVEYKKNLVYESYLFNILKDSKQFIEVYPEKEYENKDTSNNRTVDVLARTDDFIFLFDSKSLTPNSKIRIFDNDAIEKDKNRIVKCLVQVYLHIKNKLFKEVGYCDFDLSNYSLDDVYGCVVLQESPYFLLDDVYKIVAKELDIDIDTSEYKWLIKHVLYCEIRDIEKYCFTSTNLSEAIKNNNSEGFVSLINDVNNKYTYIKLNDFIKEINNKSQEMLLDILNKQRNLNISLEDIKDYTNVNNL